MRRKKFTAEEEAILLDPNADPVDRHSAIACMRSDNLRIHEALVLSFLDDPSEYLRSAALQTAVHWDARTYLPLLGQRMLQDPSEVVRGESAISAWWVVKNFPDTKETILPWLACMAASDECPPNRFGAYEHFIDLVSEGAETFNGLQRGLDPDRDIDRARLQPYLDADTTPLLH
jgi:hypothetical protein